MALRAPFLRRSTVREIVLDKQREIDAANADALTFAAALIVLNDSHPITKVMESTIGTLTDWAADDLRDAAEDDAFVGYPWPYRRGASVHARQALDLTARRLLRNNHRPDAIDPELFDALDEIVTPADQEECCNGGCDRQGAAAFTVPAGASVWVAPLNTPAPGSLLDDDVPGPGEPHGEWQLLGTTVDPAENPVIEAMTDANAALDRIHALLDTGYPCGWGQVAGELLDVASSTLTAAEHLYGDGYSARIVLTVPGPDGYPVDLDDSDTTTVRYVGGPLDGKILTVDADVPLITDVDDGPVQRAVCYDVHRATNARYGIAVYRPSIEDAISKADDGTMRIFGRPLPTVVNALKAWDRKVYDNHKLTSQAYLDGYEFALRNLHDDAVQADLNRLAPDSAKVETTLRGALLALPQGVYEGANRYHTDDQQVLHLWGNGQSFDVTWPRETADPASTLYDAPPHAPHGGLLDAAVAAGRINPPPSIFPSPLRAAIDSLAAVSSLITLSNARLATIEYHDDEWMVRIPAPGGSVAVGHGDTLSKAANDAQRIVNACLDNNDLTAA